MRRRFVEALVVIIGAVLVLFYYLDRQAPTAVSPPVPTVEPLNVETAPVVEQRPAAFPPRTPLPEPRQPEASDADPAIISLEAARSAWETARAEVESVRSELERLDSRFDSKDSEFARLESEGADPDELEEQMLVFLDGIVEEYDALEARLAAAESAEREAAAVLESLGGSRS